MCIFYNLTSASSEPQRDSESGTSGAVLVSFTTNSGLVSASCFCGRRFGLFPLHSRKHARTFLSKTCVLGPGEARGSGRGSSLLSFRSHCPTVSRVAVHLLRLQDTRGSSLCCASSRTAVSATRRSGVSVVMPHCHLIHIPFGPWPLYSLEGVSSRCLCHLHMPSPHWFVGLVHSG